MQRFLGYLKKLESRRREYDRLCTGPGVIDACWIEKYIENMEYILAGHEGMKPQGGPDFQPMFGENGKPIYPRRMPHYPDIAGKNVIEEGQLVMEYAGCSVTYNSSRIRKK